VRAALCPGGGIEPPVEPAEVDRDDWYEEKQFQKKKPSRFQAAQQQKVEHEKLGQTAEGKDSPKMSIAH